MSKDTNLSNPPVSSQAIGSKGAIDSRLPDDLDVGLAIDQHLQSLQSFGVSTVACGRSELFEIAEPVGDNDRAGSSDIAVDSVKSVPTAGTDKSKNESASSAESVLREAASVAKQAAYDVGLESPYPAPVVAADRRQSLQVLQEEVAQCTRCSQLCENRTQTVFGMGDPSSRLVLVGEGPGEQEDRSGEPFVGAAGKLLDKILAACGLQRDQVYILNAVKCRPPQNRNPKPDELSNCWGFGQRQLDILQPEFICCLGSVAAKTVLNTNLSVGKLRKQFHRYRSSKVVVTYHPAYLLRTSSAKIHAWNDMKMLMNEMGIEIPKTK
jgi:DNA polymerase